MVKLLFPATMKKKKRISKTIVWHFERRSHKGYKTRNVFRLVNEPFLMTSSNEFKLRLSDHSKQLRNACKVCRLLELITEGKVCVHIVRFKTS